MRNLQESPPSPALKTSPSKRALPFLNRGTLMQNCLSPPKGTVFQGHTKRKALSICLAQQTRLTRQLRNSPRCLPGSSVYPNQRRKRIRRKRAEDIAPNNLVSARRSQMCFQGHRGGISLLPENFWKPSHLSGDGNSEGWRRSDVMSQFSA